MLPESDSEAGDIEDDAEEWPKTLKKAVSLIKVRFGAECIVGPACEYLLMFVYRNGQNCESPLQLQTRNLRQILYWSVKFPSTWTTSTLHSLAHR